MTRPLRIEFPGAIYHVTSRGDRREPIFDDDADRLAFLDIVGAALERFDACLLAYCLMGNHQQRLGSGLAFCLERVMGSGLAFCLAPLRKHGVRSPLLPPASESHLQ